MRDNVGAAEGTTLQLLASVFLRSGGAGGQLRLQIPALRDTWISRPGLSQIDSPGQPLDEFLRVDDGAPRDRESLEFERRFC